MSVKKLFKYLLAGIIIFGVGVYFGRIDSHLPLDPGISEDLKKKDSIMKESRETIDSLKIIIWDYDSINRCLKDSIRGFETIRPISVNKIKELPLDSGVLWLKYKLREYEKQ